MSYGRKERFTETLNDCQAVDPRPWRPFDDFSDKFDDFNDKFDDFSNKFDDFSNKFDNFSGRNAVFRKFKIYAPISHRSRVVQTRIISLKSCSHSELVSRQTLNAIVSAVVL
ncbi:hypothetical protein AVEN_208746-1 [Araneus ventricosus]|uniref:Uncharacterized protein n=1 Tax=Araneus ventricosus TaxID=182803 RepID=A0A4Y2G8K2_ARAVE|nr:hypothetical protein AVEN_107352-1 [Araneus ventricosus]GBM48988.1 hypothetical protein AVEN_181685-1 [Araneus ventricosus]GBM49003.1 hypothetical protein AVEN_189330-1 [Araneus ventricosus]GBM49009.1 hypothetical protein AVEN_208746-1 [Araneus ventricosus]